MGKMGAGKTLSQTLLAIYLHLNTGVPLYANYGIKCPRHGDSCVKRINKLSDLWALDSAIVCLDELWLTMDARLWKDNVALTRFINQTRKKKLTLFFTTQHIKQVELRVRNGTDILIFAEKKPEGHWLWFIDYQYGEIGKKMLLADASKFYHLYDTYEVLQPLKMDLTTSDAPRSFKPRFRHSNE